MPDVRADPEPLVVEIVEEPRTGGPGGGGPRDFDPYDGRGGGGGDDDSGGHPGRPSNPAGTGMLGMQFMLVSISTLFVTIAIAYFWRSQTPVNWTRVPMPSFLYVSTGVMLISSFTIEGARRAFVRFDVDAYSRWIVITFFLGLAFLLAQLLALRQLIARGAYLSHNPHSSLFFVATGAHGLHLLGGMGALFYLVVRSSLRMTDVRRELTRQRGVVSVCTVYWHFLDVLWIVLFAMLLL